MFVSDSQYLPTTEVEKRIYRDAFEHAGAIYIMIHDSKRKPYDDEINELLGRKL